MNNEEQTLNWKELKDIWNTSSQTKNIRIEISQLKEELMQNVSQFEKDSIKADLSVLKDNWQSFKALVSDFEKESIKKDLDYISKLMKRLLNLFNKKE